MSDWQEWSPYVEQGHLCGGAGDARWIQTPSTTFLSCRLTDFSRGAAGVPLVVKGLPINLTTDEPVGVFTYIDAGTVIHAGIVAADPAQQALTFFVELVGWHLRDDPHPIMVLGVDPRLAACAADILMLTAYVPNRT